MNQIRVAHLVGDRQTVAAIRLVTKRVRADPIKRARHFIEEPVRRWAELLRRRVAHWILRGGSLIRQYSRRKTDARNRARRQSFPADIHKTEAANNLAAAAPNDFDRHSTLVPTPIEITTVFMVIRGPTELNLTLRAAVRQFRHVGSCGPSFENGSLRARVLRRHRAGSSAARSLPLLRHASDQRRVVPHGGFGLTRVARLLPATHRTSVERFDNAGWLRSLAVSDVQLQHPLHRPRSRRQ
jgi:hypothetical protein